MNYLKIYENLIEKARNRTIDPRFFELHHIMPKCIGGHDESHNLVYLSPKEHYIAHHLLFKEFKEDSKLRFAFLAISNFNQKRNYKITSRIHNNLMLEHKKYMSEKMKNNTISKGRKNGWYGADRSGKNNPMYGKTGNLAPFYNKTHSQKTKNYLSYINKNKKVSQETKEKLSKSQKGTIKHTDESKKSISEKMKGSNHPRFTQYKIYDPEGNLYKTVEGSENLISYFNARQILSWVNKGPIYYTSKKAKLKSWNGFSISY